MHALQDEFKLEPLDGKPIPNETLPPMPSIEEQFGFLEQLAFALKFNAVETRGFVRTVCPHRAHVGRL